MRAYLNNNRILKEVIDQENRRTTYSYESRHVASEYCSDDYGDTSNHLFEHILLTGVTHPTRAKTQYQYNPIKLSVNQYGGLL